MKKRLAALIISILTVTQVFPCYAAQSQQLEDAIIAVKSVIDIPDDMKVECQVDDDGTRVYWHNEKEVYSVELDKHNCILLYNKDTESQGQREYFGDYEKECKPIADEFLKKILGDLYSTYKYEDMNIYSYSNNMRFTYRQYINDIPVSYNTAEVYVDVTTKEVSYYYGGCLRLAEDNFPKAENVMTQTEAKNTYINSDGFALCYGVNTDYATKQVSSFLKYENQVNYYIDAVTGERVEESVVNYKGHVASASSVSEDASADYAVGNGISPYEQEKIALLENVISSDKALKIIKKYFPVAANYTVSSTNYRTDMYSNDVIMDMYGDDFYASLNGVTGEIFDFFSYEDRFDLDDENIETLPEDKAVEIALNTADKMGIKISDENAYTLVGSGDNLRLYFKRIENGIEVEGEGHTFNLDSQGNIYGYNRDYSMAKFAAVGNIIDEQKAFDIMNNYGQFGLKYIYDGEKPVLVYGFNYGVYLDPYSGDRVNYNGNPYTGKSEKPQYTDLEGEPNKHIIELLADYGYYISENEFKPDQIITQSEFYDFCDINTWNKKITDDELTFYDLCKILVDEAGYESVAQLKDIYVNTYNVDEDMVGYVNIAVACGFVDVDGNTFDGNKKVTRAEAAECIYNYYQNKDA